MEIKMKDHQVKKVALITGGSRGLDRNTVLSLAKRGIDSIFTYNSNQAEAEKVIGPVADNRWVNAQRIEVSGGMSI
jgi:NAD(P)-dependent dehydrogenase (short-subunit alcohol dehydrogenase family)